MDSPLVVFDLDGTLVDTAPDLIGTLNAVFAREGFPPVALENARSIVGGGARVMIERGLAALGQQLSETTIDRLFDAFIDHYASHIAEGSRPFPGVEPALDSLAARGFRFAVCTNKLEWLSVRLLNQLGLTPRFAAICGPDTFGVRKPDPAVLLSTIKRAGADVTTTVMVGDSGTDIATARAAGIPIVAVDFGYTETPVGALNPDRIVSDFAQLPGAVLAVLKDCGRAVRNAG